MINILWAGLSALLFPTFTADSSLGFSNSLFPIFTCIFVYLILRQSSKQTFSVRMKMLTRILGLLFSILTAWGYAIEHLGSVSYLNPFLIISIILFARIYAHLLRLFWSFLENAEMHPPFAGIQSEKMAAPSHFPSHLDHCFSYLLNRPALLAFLLLICWAPCYISTFPGNFMYDASSEYYQILYGYTRNLPLLHSALITRILQASVQLTGSVNSGVAAYVITQMVLIAILFSLILHGFYQHSAPPLLLGALSIYYAVFPVIHLLVTCSTRDVLFSAMLTWLVYLLYLLARNPESFMSSKKKLLLLAFVIVFTLLSRNNNSGPLAAILLLAACMLICFFFGKKYLLNSALFAGSSLALFYAVSAILVSICQPLYQSAPANTMSIFAQPISRAYTLYSDTWPQEDRETFESYFDMESFSYVPQNADPTKGSLLVRYHNMRDFLAYWIKIGLRHPACYLDAILANTRQMWFPGSVVDGYTAAGIHPAYEKSYFYFGKYVEEVGSRLNLLPKVFAFYENIGLMISFEKIPLVSMLFSIGFQFWLLLNCLFYSIYRKHYRLFAPLAVILVYTLCSAFVPLVLLRYFAALFFVFPMVVLFTLCPSKSLAKPEIQPDIQSRS